MSSTGMDPMSEPPPDPQRASTLAALSQTSAADIPGPYVGDYEGAAWNAQGFFMAGAAGHASKRWCAQRLLRQRDFLIITEAHVTEGARLGFTDLPGTTSWWSPGTAARAGVGIVVKHSFLHRFRLASPEWLEVEPGRLAVLRLCGASGGLDLIACYMPTGVARALRPGDATSSPSTPHAPDAPPAALRAQQEALCRRIPPLLRPDSAMAILAGDFNFVTTADGRWSKATGAHTGSSDSQEAAHWKCALPPSSLYELHQPEPTHEGPVSFARLDRVYTNQPVADQLDKRVLRSPCHGRVCHITVRSRSAGTLAPCGPHWTSRSPRTSLRTRVGRCKSPSSTTSFST